MYIGSKINLHDVDARYRLTCIIEVEYYFRRDLINKLYMPLFQDSAKYTGWFDKNRRIASMIAYMI